MEKREKRKEELTSVMSNLRRRGDSERLAIRSYSSHQSAGKIKSSLCIDVRFAYALMTSKF